MEKVTAPYGVWINQRFVVTLGFSFRHTIHPSQEGWRLDVEADGQVAVRYSDGDTEIFAVKKGDEILAIGDNVYATLQQLPGAPSPTPEGAMEAKG